MITVSIFSNKTTSTVSLIVLSLVLASSVYSHSGAKGIVKERMDAMADMGDKSKRVADMFKGKIEFDQTALVDAVDSFVLHGAKMAEQFPDTKESRTGSKTEALPRIWEDWDDFAKRADKFVELSDSLKKTVSSTDDVSKLKKAFLKTINSCSGCHKRYRMRKKK